MQRQVKNIILLFGILVLSMTAYCEDSNDEKFRKEALKVTKEKITQQEKAQKITEVFIKNYPYKNYAGVRNTLSLIYHFANESYIKYEHSDSIYQTDDLDKTVQKNQKILKTLLSNGLYEKLEDLFIDQLNEKQYECLNAIHFLSKVLFSKKSIPMLKKIYWKSDLYCKGQILAALAILGDKGVSEQTDFLVFYSKYELFDSLQFVKLMVLQKRHEEIKTILLDETFDFQLKTEALKGLDISNKNDIEIVKHLFLKYCDKVYKQAPLLEASGETLFEKKNSPHYKYEFTYSILDLFSNAVRLKNPPIKKGDKNFLKIKEFADGETYLRNKSYSILYCLGIGSKFFNDQMQKGKDIKALKFYANLAKKKESKKSAR